MGTFFEEVKKNAKIGWEQAIEKEQAAKQKAAADKEARRQMYVPGATFSVAQNFKTRLWTRGLIGSKMKDGGNHWIGVGGERNIQFLRHEKEKLAFQVRWGIGKNYWEMQLTEQEALDYLIPENPPVPAPAPAGGDAAARTSAPVAEQLRDMKALLDEGVITQEEFEKFKASLLG